MIKLSKSFSVWFSIAVFLLVMFFAAHCEGVSWLVIGAILVPSAGLLFVGNSIFGPKPIAESKWEHFACFVTLVLVVSFLLLAASGTLETLDIGGNKIGFVRQQVKEVKLLSENVADLALLTTKNGLRSASINWLGPDIRVIAETRDKTIELLKKSGTDQPRIERVKKEFDHEIETSLKRELYFKAESIGVASDVLATNLFPNYNRKQIVDAIEKAGQSTELEKHVGNLDYYLSNDSLPSNYTPPH